MTMITAQDVKKLRDQTGAGMMDCKKALAEAGGDFERAIDILRKKGQKVSAARADKETTEGAVFAQTNATHSQGALIALSCETDFVAKNEAFQQLGQQILESVLAHQPADMASLLQLTVEGLTVQEKLTDLVGKVGEKITISAYKILSSETVAPYIHTGGKLGVLVALQGGQGPQVIEAGQDVAMQIAAMNPLAVDKDGIEAAVIDKELAIGKELARNEGKPEAMLDKIAQGRLHKFFKENTLLQQPFVKDNGLTIDQYLKGVAPNLTVTSFARIAVAG
ncbi:MAG: translation elongation factor Ts [Bacteroidota bacterium]